MYCIVSCGLLTILLYNKGYMGSTVLTRLINHPKKDTFEVTVLVRSEEKAKILESFGVKTVIGSIKDTALVEKLAEQAHVLFNIVSRLLLLTQRSSFTPHFSRRTQTTVKPPRLSFQASRRGMRRPAMSPS